MAKRNKRQYHELNEFTDDRQLYIVNGRYDNIKKQAGLKLNEIHPKTKAQSDTFDSYNENYNLMLHGCAGT